MVIGTNISHLYIHHINKKLDVMPSTLLRTSLSTKNNMYHVWHRMKECDESAKRMEILRAQSSLRTGGLPHFTLRMTFMKFQVK